MAPAVMKQRVEQILGPSTQVHAVAAVRVYISESNLAWEWTKVAGAAAIAFNPQESTRYIYVVDLHNNSIHLSQELYENFSYESPRDFFHSFEMDDCVAGLSFADTSDAKAFFQAVKSGGAPPSRPQPPQPRAQPTPPSHTAPATTPGAPPSPPQNRNSGPPRAPPAAPPAPAQAPASAPAPAQANAAGGTGGKKKGTGFFAKIKSALGASDVPEDFAISDPRGFRHESHIGWDPDAGFEIRNIPPEWRKLFQAAGVKKGDLRDAETAKFVMNVIGDTLLNAQANQDAPAAPPPPPAPSGGGAPPPPPPPPPAGGPPAPRAPPAPAKAASRPPPVNDSRGDLMASIRGGTELRKVDPNEAHPASLPDINSLNAADSKNLVDTLAAAMASRRMVIQRQDDDEDEEEEADEEWSD